VALLDCHPYTVRFWLNGDTIYLTSHSKGSGHLMKTDFQPYFL